MVVWLILLPFVLIGLFACQDQPVAALWHLLAALSLGLLLNYLNRPFKDVGWIWVTLIWFLVGCFVKSWIAVAMLDDATLPISPHEDYLGDLTRKDILTAYIWICISFIVFCVVAVAVSSRGRHTSRTFQALPMLARAPQVRRAVALVFLIAIAGTAASVLQSALGFGVMGTEQEHLPYRISTLIIRFRTDIAIGLLALCAWNAERLESRPLMFLALGALATLATWDAVIRTSRASMLFYGLPIMMLWFMSGRRALRSALLSSVVMALTVLMFPVWSDLRQVRSFEGARLIEGLREVVQRRMEGAGQADLRGASATLLIRMGGADGLWRTQPVLRDQPWSTRWSAIWHEGITVYYTRDVMGLSTRGRRAPSALGTLALLSGTSLTPLALGLFLGAIGLSWTWLGQLEIAAVGRALLGSTILFWLSEGSFGPKDIFALVFSVGTCSVVWRYWLSPWQQSSPRARIAGRMRGQRQLTSPAMKSSPRVAGTWRPTVTDRRRQLVQ